MPSRVLHVTPSFYPAHRYGGPVAALYDLCRAQKAAGLSVRVLTSDAAGEGERLDVPTGRFVSDYGVPTLYARATVGEDIAPALVPALYAQLGWADLVHVTGLWSPTSLLGILGAVGTVSRRRPCVISPRGTLLPFALSQGAGKKQLFLRALGPVLRRVAGWHATSGQEAAAITELATPRIVGPSAAIAVVPNGIFMPPVATPVTFTSTEPIFMTLGRVHPIKNLELAILALALVRRTVPRATLRIVGPEEPGYGATLRERVRVLKLDEAVQFTGPLLGEAKLAALRAASVLWLCSHMESFGNVVLEALAAGTPVVAAQTTPWTHLPELGGGRCVEKTAEAFAAASLELLSEQSTESLRAEVSRRCQVAVRDRYSFAAVESQMRSLYERAQRAAAFG